MWILPSFLNGSIYVLSTLSTLSDLYVLNIHIPVLHITGQTWCPSCSSNLGSACTHVKKLLPNPLNRLPCRFSSTSIYIILILLYSRSRIASMLLFLDSKHSFLWLEHNKTVWSITITPLKGVIIIDCSFKVLLWLCECSL